MDFTAMILKALSALTGPVGDWFKRRTRHWRASRYAIAHIASDGPKPGLKLLRKALSSGELERLLRAGGPDDIQRARGFLSAAGLERWMQSDPDLVELLRRGYLGSQSTSDVLAVISGQVNAVSGALGQLGSSSFDSDVLRINPTLAADARSLLPQVPSIARIVSLLVRTSDRAALLKDWSSHLPTWIASDASIYGWLGEAAVDVDANECAVEWFDRAIDAGAQPRGYWMVRRVWAAKLGQDASATEYLAPVANHPLVQAVSPGSTFDERIALLDAWEPSSASQSAIRVQLALQFKKDADYLDDVIRDGVSAWRSENFSGAAIMAVEALLRRSGTKSSSKSNDLGQALSLALDVRNSRRAWGSSSGVAVARAMHVYMLLLDPERAWSLSQLEPDGEATPAEFYHPDVREAAVVLMAERGSVEMALGQLDASFSEAARLQVQAREAELLLDHETANTLWAQAIAATDDWNDKSVLCIRLATKGVLDPFVDELRVDNPEIAEEIALVAALFGGKQGAEQRARDAAIDNPRIAHLLISFLAKNDRHEDLVFVAERAGETWQDPDDWHKAARSHQVLGRLDLARDRAQRALQLASPEWGDRFSALGLLFEIEFQNQDWTAAAIHANAMVQARPNNTSARWALVIVKYYAGNEDEAFSAWKDAPSMLLPSDHVHAAVWFALFRLRGSEMSTLEDALATARQYSSDSQVRSLAAGAFLMAPITEPPDSRISDLLAEFEREYPDDHGFTRIEIDSDDPSDILAKLDDASGGPRDYTAIEESLENGTLPIGFVAKITGRHLVEALLLRMSSARFVGPVDPISERGFVDANAGKVVVLDATAVVTLATLPEDIGNLLYATFAGGRTSSRQLMDANSSRESLGRDSGGRFVPSGPGRPPQFILDNPDERFELGEFAKQVVWWFRKTDRVAGVAAQARTLDALGDADGAWIGALEVSITSGQAFWCDDRATRQLAAAEGIAAFGTSSVIEHLRSNGAISAELADSIEASLLMRSAVGIPYRFGAYALALSLNAFSPRGISTALVHSGPDDVANKLSQITLAMGRAENPEWIEEWARAGVQYVSRASLSGQETANAIIFIGNVVRHSWVDATTLPFIVSGAKRAAGSAWPEILRESLRQFVNLLESSTGPDLARKYVLGLIGRLSAEDHQIGLEVVLEA